MPVKGTRVFVASAALILALSMAGCSTQAKKVNCGGTLKPINRPAPLAAPAVPVKELKPSDGKATDEK